MKTIEVIAGNMNYKAIDIGSPYHLSEYQFLHPKFGHYLKGKLFIGEILQTTGAEISFSELPPETTVSFLHKHYKHEEIYIFLKGFGQFQVDDDVFRIKEGSIVRVSPNGNRTLRNDSKDLMVYMVVQSHANTLAGYDVSDGYRVNGEIKIEKS